MALSHLSVRACTTRKYFNKYADLSFTYFCKNMFLQFGHICCVLWAKILYKYCEKICRSFQTRILSLGFKTHVTLRSCHNFRNHDDGNDDSNDSNSDDNNNNMIIIFSKQ